MLPVISTTPIWKNRQRTQAENDYRWFLCYSGVVDSGKMREIADSIGAYLFVDMAHVAGLVAAGVYPNPVPHAHVVTTTTHKTLAGPRGGLILAKGGSESCTKN